MPAAVDSMMSVREMPWHKQGVVVPEYPGSWEAARVLAGLDWEPELVPVIDTAQIVCDADGKPDLELTMLRGWNKIVRSDTRALLSVRPDSYSLIDHTEMGIIVETVLDQPNVRWETAGSLHGGRAVWCLCRLDEPVQLPGDSTMTYPYMGITNHHDGTGACTLRTTAVRIVCGNTMGAAEAEGERTGLTFSFVHRGNWREHIDDARNAVLKARTQFASYVELCEDLLEIHVTPVQRELFVKLFIPSPPDTFISDRVAANIAEARTAVRGILGSVTTAEVAHTAYGLVQGATEYLDHVRTARSWESRLNRTLIRPDRLKLRAITLAREVATAGA